MRSAGWNDFKSDKVYLRAVARTTRGRVDSCDESLSYHFPVRTGIGFVAEVALLLLHSHSLPAAHESRAQSL